MLRHNVVGAVVLHDDVSTGDVLYQMDHVRFKGGMESNTSLYALSAH